MAVTKYDIEYVKGDSHQIQVTDVGEVDKMYMTVKCPSNLVRIQKIYYKDPSAGTSNGIEVQEDGAFLITLNSSDTDNLKVGTKYNYDVQVNVGEAKATIIKGVITLEDEITTVRNEV